MSHRGSFRSGSTMASAFIALGLAVAGCALRSASSTYETSLPDKGSLMNLVNVAGVGQEGARLFEKETFGGNGRTCSTCHREADGFSTTPASAQKRFVTDRADPLFRQTDSRDGVGNQYTRLLAHATVRVEVPLICPNIWLEDDPTARSVVLNRGIPELLNTPALDAKLMSDGRAASLEQQALDAI